MVGSDPNLALYCSMKLLVLATFERSNGADTQYCIAYFPPFSMNEEFFTPYPDIK
jgi:hypothetical protein